MKAIVTATIHYQPQFNVDDEVEIIPGMETDGEGIWNCPCGRLVYCKSTTDERCGYMPIAHLRITETGEGNYRDADYFTRIRDHVATEIFIKGTSIDKYVSDAEKNVLANRAIGLANEYVKCLREW